MKVILRDDVSGLGKIGEMLDVKNGYARNFLIPRKLAVLANTKNFKALEHEKRNIAERSKKIISTAEARGKELSAISVTIKAKAGEEEKLFGSVTTKDIEKALKAQGVEIDRKKLVLDEPIKRLGDYTVKVKVHPEVAAEIALKVVPEE